jgi:hypothetical protein
MSRSCRGENNHLCGAALKRFSPYAVSTSVGILGKL